MLVKLVLSPTVDINLSEYAQKMLKFMGSNLAIA